jgi:hypothetical protein
MTGFLPLLLLARPAAIAAPPGGLLTGFELRGLDYQGPGEWRHSAEPIWVYDYHLLRIRYRASGFAVPDAPVLTLRPGSVGPVTPGAANRENPFATGQPVVVLRARDLRQNGASHLLEVELRGRMRTAQVDQLIFSLPAGARLGIDALEFRGDPEVLPCGAADRPALPAGIVRTAAHGPLDCAGAPSTSLRGRERIRIDGGGRRGGTLYLSLMAHFAGLSDFAPGRPVDAWRVKESTETAHVVARIHYAAGPAEDQFPLLVAQRRHALLNRKPALYALALDPGRALESVELLDRSPHAQIVLFAAGLSQDPPPGASGEALPALKPRLGAAAGEAGLSGSRWFRIEPPARNLRPRLRTGQEPRGRTLSLAVTNTGAVPQEFALVFPSLEVRPSSDPNDVYYLFPRQGTVLARTEQALESPYSTEFPLQFLDVFSPGANRGVGLVVRDLSGRWKTFRLKKTGASVLMEVEYRVRLAPGETFQAPDASVVHHAGDWREGFDAYRRWVATWYRPAGPRPAWLRSAFWARRDYPVGGSGQLFDVKNNRYTFDALIRDGEAFGGIDFIDISGWALSDKVGRVGDYPIELGGPADLRRNIALARDAGIPTGLYFEGYLIDRNSAIGRRSAAEWQLIDASGRGAWWPGGSPELFVCPHIPAWHSYLAGRMAAVAAETGAQAVYLDEHGIGTRKCYSAAHGHPPGESAVPGEIAMAKAVRRTLDAAGLNQTAIYLEFNPVDAAAPYYDAAFCYSIPFADPRLSPVKLNLWRFVFPDVRLWDMLTIGIHPRVLSPEDFRLSLWHGDGLWLKGHSGTWYGEDLLAFIRRARALLKQHAAAFGGRADPLVDPPHPAVLVNRFRGRDETVYTLFNSAYRSVRFAFAGRDRVLGPRDVDVVATPF